MGEYSHGRHESLLGAISVGFFLVLVGLLFIGTPNLTDKVVTFFNDFHTAPFGNTSTNVPVPKDLGQHVDVYLAARTFSEVWGVFLIAMLGARFILDSPLRRKAQNLGDIVFWLGAVYLIQTYLVQPTQALTIDNIQWFEFWALIVALIGVSLMARGIFLAAAHAARRI